ncbi:MAG: GNAT family N-acetyltransferase [Acidimicrobiia bacterium]|nr:GNAT family N-acetyltransferase [Acidimicrobiia bacterium]
MGPAGDDPVRFDVVPAESDDARWCLEHYYRELADRFADGFDPTAALPADAGAMTPPTGVFVVARVDARLVACGGVQSVGSGVADLKRMWVASDARGVGLGRRLLAELERHAGELEFSTLRLETNRALSEAIALYRSAGYREGAPHNDEPHADHWFSKELPPPARA